jgi:hypothetical protein
MDLSAYFQEADGKISFSRQQASDFAKNEADDFNPIHDVDAKRFCVPGDLLFSVILSRYGLSQSMNFTFSGMVVDGVNLQMPASAATHLSITDSNKKEYLNLERSGEHTHDPELINALAAAYVAYSGHSFPEIMVPLMAQTEVMINPARPMVMYESMLLEVDSFDFTTPRLLPNKQNTRLDVNGKRGKVTLAFDLKQGERNIGHGEKHILLSGLRPYEQQVIDDLQSYYDQRKSAHARVI